ncbi:hypothetical protein Poli38472_002895 [Pythium oligandrum]|uniref:Uroporphyrinogen-III synthase n=1 Tax=Pythium oligandrum TaxID=41045 RepID=A0A8K1FB75_PYTOL|nr:hypothetical protein Poli38472_002895 [Pythium oligandrum]|eukprot:TMW56970.1 hypothetical protein Poli38472_002895 [Pythium oligandrum]
MPDADASNGVRRSVLLLKAADAKYRDAFVSYEDEGLSFDVHFADVLTFEYVNQAELRECLIHLEDYGALLLTSPRACIAIRNVVESLDGSDKDRVLATLTKMTIFSVGKATSRELECYGIECQGDECGSAEVLSEYLHHESSALPADLSQKTTLFLCGEKRSNTLPESFVTRCLPLKELTVYQTCAIPDFQLPEGCPAPNWIVYFSPSGIKATRSLPLAWETVKKGAIGTSSPLLLLKYQKCGRDLVGE